VPNRILKESICRSDEIDSLSWFEECLFYRLIVNCDDFGRFDGREKIINSICFPLKDIRDSDLKKALDKLSAAGLVRRYMVQGRPVLQLVTWERHQQIRAKKSKYPGPERSDSHEHESSCNQMISDDNKCPRNPIQSNPNPNPNPNICSEPVGSEQVLKESPKNPARNKQREANELFESLWNRYPNKRGKGNVSDAKKRALLEIGEEHMLRAIQRYVDEHDALERSGAFTPNWKNGSTFFNSGYIDYLDENYRPAPVETKARATGFSNFTQSNTDWESVADQVMAAQERAWEKGDGP
jgi:hypothetical protein